MDKDIEKQLEEILISGDKAKLNEILANFSVDEKKKMLTSVLLSAFSKLQNDKMFENTQVYNKAMQGYVIGHALEKAKIQGKNVNLTVIDAAKINLINKCAGMKQGDETLITTVTAISKGMMQMGFKQRGIEDNENDIECEKNENTFYIVRTGGDEFLLVTVGGDELEENSTITPLDAGLQLAETIVASKAPIKCYKEGYGAFEVKEGLTHGTEIINYMNPVDMEKVEEVKDLAEKNSTPEGKKRRLQEKYGIVKDSEIDSNKDIIIDEQKELFKKWAIENMLKNLQLLYNTSEKSIEEGFNDRLSIEIVDEGLDTNVKNENSKNSLMLDRKILSILSKMVSNNGMKKQENLDINNEYDYEDIENFFLNFGTEFVQDGKENCVKRNSRELILEMSSKIENLSMTYIELDKLKLINTAKGHKGGDIIIDDFLKIVQDSIDECISPDEKAYTVKMSGNGLVLMCDINNLEDILVSINSKSRDYENSELDVTMDVYMETMNPSKNTLKDFDIEYINASDRVNVQKNEKKFNVIECICSENDENKIFYSRQNFTLDEVDEFLINEFFKYDLEDELTAINELIDKGQNPYEYINQTFENTKGFTEEEKINAQKKYDLSLQYVTWNEIVKQELQNAFYEHSKKFVEATIESEANEEDELDEAVNE